MPAPLQLTARSLGRGCAAWRDAGLGRLLRWLDRYLSRRGRQRWNDGRLLTLLGDPILVRSLPQSLQLRLGIFWHALDDMPAKFTADRLANLVFCERPGGVNKRLDQCLAAIGLALPVERPDSAALRCRPLIL